MPDPVMGERVCAYIQPKPGGAPEFSEIISFLKSQGASVLHLPERIEFVDTMPLTGTGKIDKRNLMEDIKRGWDKASRSAHAFQGEVSCEGVNMWDVIVVGGGPAGRNGSKEMRRAES